MSLGNTARIGLNWFDSFLLLFNSRVALKENMHASNLPKASIHHPAARKGRKKAGNGVGMASPPCRHRSLKLTVIK